MCKHKHNIVIIEGTEVHQNCIDMSLKSMQEIVGGYIEIVRLPQLPSGYILICNEDGLLRDLPVNKLGLRGVCFVCKESGEDLVGLEDEELQKVMELIQI